MVRLARSAWAVLAYNVVVILWGAIVRATGSGAGCGSHWPLCNGVVVPRSPALATVIEFSHRLTSGLALVLVVGLALWVFKACARGHPARPAAIASVVFVLGEAAVGAGLVLFELVAGNKSTARGLVMATHLVNTLLLLAALTLTAHHLRPAPRPRARGGPAPYGALTMALAGVLLVAVSGALAALGDTLFPASSLSEAFAQDLSITAHLLVRVRVLHPFLAVVLAAGILALVNRLWRRAPAAVGRGRAGVLAALVAAQSLGGALNVALLAPVWLQVVHLLLADLLWIALVLTAADSMVETLGAPSRLGGPPLATRPSESRS